MGYVEQIMGDSEQVLYRTHRHVIVLLQQIVGWLFAFLVFLGAGLAVLLYPSEQGGDVFRWFVGLVALISLVMPLFLIFRALRRGARGRDLVAQIWRPVLVCLLILLVALVTMFRPDLRYIGWLALVLALIALAQIARSFLDWLNERFLVTNRRVIQVKGTVNKQVSDSALEKVNDVVMQQSVVGRLLRYGTVEIITGSDIGLNEFHRISNPVRFKRAMLNAKEQLHGTGLGDDLDEAVPQVQPGRTPIAASAQAPSPAADIPDLLAELDELRQKGILSEEEFQAKKQDLLGRL